MFGDKNQREQKGGTKSAASYNSSFDNSTELKDWPFFVHSKKPLQARVYLDFRLLMIAWILFEIVSKPSLQPLPSFP